MNDLYSDGDDEEEFLPSKKDLQSSSSEEEMGRLDSDEEIFGKKSKWGAAGSRTPRSTQKDRSSARTPRKTPVRKVRWVSHLCSARWPFFSCAWILDGEL